MGERVAFQRDLTRSTMRLVGTRYRADRQGPEGDPLASKPTMMNGSPASIPNLPIHEEGMTSGRDQKR